VWRVEEYPLPALRPRSRNISTHGKFNIKLAKERAGGGGGGRKICVIFVRVLIKKGYNKRFVYICYQFFRRARRVVVCFALVLASRRRLKHHEWKRETSERFLRSYDNKDKIT
jgi:hypothetical protein